MPRTLALLDDPRFDLHAPRAYHPERVERLAAARAAVRAGLDGGPVESVAARAATRDELRAVHGDAHISFLERSLHGHGHLDADTFFSEGTREAAWFAAGGTAALAQRLLAPAAPRSGVAIVRPPGHHATPSQAMGFCLLNNVAVGARAALASGAARVAIVDWDVHHGNGTQDAFLEDPRVLFISTHQYPFYPGTGASTEIGEGRGRGLTANIALPAGAGPEAYGAAFRRVVLPLLTAFAPDLVLVSAGFDAHQRDPLGGMALDAATYGALTTAMLGAVPGAPVGVVLEGGYDLRAIADSMESVVRALAGQRTELPHERERALDREAIEASVRALSPHWAGLGAADGPDVRSVATARPSTK